MSTVHKPVWMLITCTSFLAVITAPHAARGETRVEFDKQTLADDKAYPQVVDVDGDGRNDVILRGRTDLRWARFPDFKEVPMAAEESFFGDRYAAADVDGDGDVDVITGNGRSGGQFLIDWFENPRPAADPATQDNWQRHRIGDQGDYIKDLEVADIDRDGSLDIVLRSHEYTMIFFQRDDRWRGKKIGHRRKEGMALGDLDVDGDLDIVLNGFWLETPADPVRGQYQEHTIDDRWYSQRTGSWQDNCVFVAVGDLNEDRIPDVVYSHSEKVGYPIVWYSVDTPEQAKTGQWKQHVIADEFPWCETLRIGDVDRDGRLDVMAAKFERNPREPQWANKPPYPIVVYYNREGDGSVWDAQQVDDTGTYAGVLGDVGSDGDIDIVGSHSYYRGPVHLFENRLVSADSHRAIDRWTYIQLTDKNNRTFALDAADLDGDGMSDVVSGPFFYRNPGGDMTGAWEQSEIAEGVEACLIVDVDGDELSDVIALGCNKQYWFEATDTNCTDWKGIEVGSVQRCNHRLGAQQYSLAQIVPGGKPEVVIAGAYLEIPDDPHQVPWPAVEINRGGYAFGDIDGDGLLDLASSIRVEGDGLVQEPFDLRWNCSQIVWFKNPGSGGEWPRYDVGLATHEERCALADLNGDGKLDITVTEERYPWMENASIYWYEQPEDPAAGEWTRHKIVTQHSTNSMEVADMDLDGDADIVTCEHQHFYHNQGVHPDPPRDEELQIWENDGAGNFTLHIIDRGKESHLGARLFDMDADGDLDIVSIAWRDAPLIHLWRNDSIQSQGD